MVVNDWAPAACPCCGALHVEELGPLSYPYPLEFSTTPVRLARVPRLCRCRRCGSGFTRNAVRPGDAEALYARGDSGQRWSQGEVPFADAKPEGVVRTLAALVTGRPRLADVGCGAGALLDFARQRGADVIGVEWSTAGRRRLEARGLETTRDFADLPAGAVDVLCAFDLVEHLYDLPGFLAAARRILRPGGKLVILTGDPRCLSARLAGARWWYASYPEHVVFPSASFLGNLPGWTLERSLATWASTPCQKGWGRAVAGSLWHRLRGRFRGLPSLGPDHRLFVLRRAG